MKTVLGERGFRMLTKEIAPQYEVFPGHCFGNVPKIVKYLLLVVAFIYQNFYWYGLVWTESQAIFPEDSALTIQPIENGWYVYKLILPQ